MTDEELIAELQKLGTAALEGEADNDLIIDHPYFSSSFMYGMFVGARWMEERNRDEFIDKALDWIKANRIDILNNGDAVIESMFRKAMEQDAAI